VIPYLFFSFARETHHYEVKPGEVADNYMALSYCSPVRRICRVTERLRYRFGTGTNEHLIARAAEEGFLF
jgi:hypothetical protein